MPPICPRCHSNLVAKRNLAKKTVGSIGAATGVMGGVMTTLNDDTDTINLASAVLAGLAAGLVVGTAGVRLGEFMDQNILDNWQCLRCGYVFGDGNI